MYTCLKYLSVADATVITHSQACFVLLVAHLVLGEKCGLIPTICGLGIIAGIFIIARPPLLTGNAEFDADTLKGTLYALAVLFVLTILHVILRYLRTVHYTIITFALAIFGTIVTVSWAFYLGKLECPRTPADWGMALGLCTASMIAQTLLNIAFKFEDASVISLVMSGSVIFSFGWQWLFFSVIPDKYR
jgi:drug/metabolite transporter (DMT)-like permease